MSTRKCVCIDARACVCVERELYNEHIPWVSFIVFASSFEIGCCLHYAAMVLCMCPTDDDGVTFVVVDVGAQLDMCCCCCCCCCLFLLFSVEFVAVAEAIGNDTTAVTATATTRNQQQYCVKPSEFKYHSTH